MEPSNKRKWVVLILTLAFIAGGVLLFFKLPNRATQTDSPVDDEYFEENNPNAPNPTESESDGPIPDGGKNNDGAELEDLPPEETPPASNN